MGAKVTYQHYSVQEYLNIVEESQAPYEYDGGRLIKLSGGTYNHGMIIGNIYHGFRNALEFRPEFTVCTAGVKVRVESTNSFFKPDIFVYQDQPRWAREDPESITNPILIVEVLSKSTRDYDQGTKWRRYRQLQSLRDYIVVDQYRQSVDHYSRKNKGFWSLRILEGIHGSLSLPGMGLDLPIADFYAGTKMCSHFQGSAYGGRQWDDEEE